LVNAVDHLLGRAALERHGARVALICGTQSLTYAELAGRVARASNALRELGLAPGDRVLLLMRDTPELAAAWLGAVHAGFVAIALNTKLFDDEYRYVVADSGVRLAIVEDAFASARPGVVDALACAARLLVAGDKVPDHMSSWRDAMTRAAPQSEAFAVRTDTPAFWLYSSGTTGKPKGIIHAHAGVRFAGQALREVFGVEPGDKVLATSKLFFAYALENGLLGPLANGATAIMSPEWAEPEPVIDLVARHRPAVFLSVPTFYRKLLRIDAVRLAPFTATRRCVAAGERLPVSVMERWREVTGHEILSAYGMSETFCVCMATPPGSARDARTGKLLAGVSSRLITEKGVAQPGEPGVLWIKHPALALGYANRPEQTRAQFHEGWFCTNDVFVADAEGYFAHHGRSDEMLKIAGQWVQPAELEDAVLSDPAITEAACVRIIDADGFERLALFVVASDTAAAAIRAAALACALKLPRHKRPKWIRAVPELPRTASGKVQHFRLRALIEEGPGAG
jgi:3-hydroxybenzoate/4-hydroxybenzoate---CoA ligase